MSYFFTKCIPGRKLRIDSQIGFFCFRAGEAHNNWGLDRLIELALLLGVRCCAEGTKEQENLLRGLVLVDWQLHCREIEETVHR
jgi:hypothetical protein